MLLYAMLFSLFSGYAAPEPPACVEVGGDTISVRHLASYIPALQFAHPKQVLGKAPELGIRRVLSARELNTWIKRYAGGAELVGPNVSVCVIRRSVAVEPAEIQRAIREAFGPNREVDVAIAEYSKRQVDHGVLRFPLESLPQSASVAKPVLWRGWHIMNSGQRTPVWAKVRLSERVLTPVAEVDLVAGQPISSDAVTLRETERFPAPKRTSASPLPSVVGRPPLQNIRKGDPVLAKDLGTPIAVRRGDPVHVEVAGPSVHLSFAGRAENSGKAGQRISVSSPVSRNMFQAVIQEKGHVIVPIRAIPSGRQ